MLFDIRGKRRHLVQVSFALLALLFLVGFLGFGIGVGGGPGGIFDALGISNSSNSGGSATGVYQDHVDKANEKLAKNPKDTQALLSVAENEFQLAKSGISTDPNTGQPTGISNDAHTSLGKAADAWSKYLKLNKGKADLGTAYNMVLVYILLNDATGAVKTQQVIVDAKPTASSYAQLAQFQYAEGDISGGDASRDKAVKMAPKSQQKTYENQLAQMRKQGIAFQKQQQLAKKQAKQQGGTTTTPGANPLQNPLGGFGSSTGTTP
jgi:hypothetical protein